MATNHNEGDNGQNFFLQMANEDIVASLREEYSNASTRDPNRADFNAIQENFPDLWQEVTHNNNPPPAQLLPQQADQQQQPQPQQPEQHHGQERQHLNELTSERDFFKVRIPETGSEAVLRQTRKLVTNICEITLREFSIRLNTVDYVRIAMIMGIMHQLLAAVFDDVLENEYEEDKEIQIEITHPNMQQSVTSGRTITNIYKLLGQIS